MNAIWLPPKLSPQSFIMLLSGDIGYCYASIEDKYAHIGVRPGQHTSGVKQ